MPRPAVLSSTLLLIASAAFVVAAEQPSPVTPALVTPGAEGPQAVTPGTTPPPVVPPPAPVPSPIPSPAPGDPATTIEALQRKIETLERRLDELPTRDDVQGVQADLENTRYQIQRDREVGTSVIPSTARALTFGGTIQGRANWTSKPTNIGNGATSYGSVGSASNNSPVVDGRRSTFDINQAQLFFNGSLYRDYAEGRNLTARLALLGNFNAVTGGANASNNSLINVTDAYSEYQFLPTIDPAGNRISARFGQQLLPFGLENQVDESLRPVITSAQFSSVAGIGVREIGLIFRGVYGVTYDYGYNYNSSLVTWAAGVVNGSGPNRADDNNFKDLIGRAEVKVPTEYHSWLRELRFGASAYRGRQNLVGSGAAPTVLADPLSPPGPTNPRVPTGGAATGFARGQGEKTRYGVDVYYSHNPIGFTYEFALLRDEVLTLPTPLPVGANAAANAAAAAAASSISTRIGTSHTATVFYNIGAQFLTLRNQGRYDDWWPKTYQPFFRYDRFDPSRSVSENQTDIYTLGFNLFFAQTTKLQLNLNRRVVHRNAAPAGSSRSLITHEALLQLQYGF